MWTVVEGIGEIYWSVPWNEWSSERKFHHGNEESWELNLENDVPDTDLLSSSVTKLSK